MNMENTTAIFDPSERFVLNSESPVPLYHQMEEIIVERIAEKRALGKMLPPEKDLMEIFGVSRATVKRTLHNLVTKGMVERKRALGTRVIRQEVTEDLGRLTSYSEEMEAKGLDVVTDVLRVGYVPPSEDVREKLQLQPGEGVLRVERLRGNDQVFPVVLLKSLIPAHYGIETDNDFSGSLYRLLETVYRIDIEWAEEEIRAGKATEEEAQLLGIKPGSSVLIMERLTYNRENRPLEFVRGVYRPEHHKFRIRLKR